VSATDSTPPVRRPILTRLVVRICVATIIFVIAIAFLVHIGWLGYSASRFHGDGRITAGGFWSYPRYSVTFDAIDLGEAKAHSWKFGGLPATRMWFGLKSIDPLMEDRDRTADVSIAVTMKRPDGTVVAGVIAPLKEWTLNIVPAEPSFKLWHPKMLDLQTRSDVTYVLTVEVSTPDGMSAGPLATPILEGGGNELP
jgi:hypothetical protein